MDKIAILLMCHKNVTQVNRLIMSFNKELYDVYVHIDLKSSINKNDIINQDNVYIIPNPTSVFWGDISQIDAELLLLNEARNKGYTHYWLMSGQDLLLKSSDDIYNEIANNNYNYITIFDNIYNKRMKRIELSYPKFMVKNSFFAKVIKNIYMIITGGRGHTFKIFKRPFSKKYKFIFGYQWFCFNRDFVEYIMNFLENNKDYYKEFSKCIIPDESFFHTILINSDYKNTLKEGLTFVDWSENNRSPKTFKIEDYDNLIKSNYYAARKFDSNIDDEVVEKILEINK